MKGTSLIAIRILFLLTASAAISSCASMSSSNFQERDCTTISSGDGKKLCSALNSTNSEMERINNISRTLDNKKFDYTLIGLGILSTAALAADSHASVVEGLGIATASMAGIKTYNNTKGRIGIYGIAIRSLACLELSGAPALTYDTNISSLKKHVDLLSDARALIPIYISNSNVSPTLTTTLQQLETPSKAGVELGKSALASYKILGDVIEVMSTDIIDSMNLSIENARDISTIIDGIESSIIREQQETEETEEQREETQDGLDDTNGFVANQTIAKNINSLFASANPKLRNTINANAYTDNQAAEALILALRQSMTYIKDNAPEIKKALTEVKSCKKN